MKAETEAGVWGVTEWSVGDGREVGSGESDGEVGGLESARGWKRRDRKECDGSVYGGVCLRGSGCVGLGWRVRLRASVRTRAVVSALGVGAAKNRATAVSSDCGVGRERGGVRVCLEW